MSSPSSSPSLPASAVALRSVPVPIVSSNPVLSVKSCRKLKSTLSTCYLAFGASTLRLAAVQGTQRSALKFHAADIKQQTGEKKKRKHSATADGDDAQQQQQQAASFHSSSAPASASSSSVLLRQSRASVSQTRRGERQRRPLTATAAAAAAAAAAPQQQRQRQQRRREREEQQEDDDDEEEERAAARRHRPARHHHRTHRSPCSSSASQPSRRHHRHHQQKERQRSVSQLSSSSSSSAAASASTRGRVVVKTEAEEDKSSTAAPSSLSSVHARGESLPSVSLPPAVLGLSLAECPVYRPSAAQWQDPLGFVQSVQAEASRAGMCLTGDHRVLSRAGWQSIARVQVGDDVLSFNIATYAMEWKPVLQVDCHAVDPANAADDLFRMQGSGMDVIATRDHRMLLARPGDGAHGLQGTQLAYQTVGDLLSLTFALNLRSTLTSVAHSRSRAVVRSGCYSQPSVKVVIPELEQVCDWWWEQDEQRGFLQFLGFWLRDGDLQPDAGVVCIKQKKEPGKQWLELQLLPRVFPRWWRRDAQATPGHVVYSIRCPPLYAQLRLMAVGPLGYDPRDSTQLRSYPHFTKDEQLAAEEQQSDYFQADCNTGRLSSWTEADMLAAFTAAEAADPGRCWWCRAADWEDGNEMVRCSADQCQHGSHLQCDGLTAAPECDWLCPACRDVVNAGREEDDAAPSPDPPSSLSAVSAATTESSSTQSVASDDRRFSFSGDSGHGEEEDGKEGRQEKEWFHLKRWLGSQQQMADVYSRLSRQQAVALLDGFCRPDGGLRLLQYGDNGEPAGVWKCSSSSFPLIDQLMLIGQLAGAAVSLQLHSRAGQTRIIRSRPVTFTVEQWKLCFTFPRPAGISLQCAALAQPLRVSGDVDASKDVERRGYCGYVDDGFVYCVQVQDNENFLTQRLSNVRLDSGDVGVQAHSVFVGNCRIVPPAGWQPPFALDSARFQFTTRLQNIHQLQQAAPFVQGSRAYNLQQFQTLAETFKQAFFSKQRRDKDRDRRQREQQPPRSSPPAPLPALPQPSSAQIEQAYWDVVCGRSASSSAAAASSSFSSVQVEYGADLDSSVGGSGFESLQLKGGVLANAASLYAGSIGWNLRALPLLRGSLLGQLPEHVPGVSTPWLYVGMLFSTFCWHTEDSFLLSMSYLHCGASKSWYAAPGAQVLQVEQAMRCEHPAVFAARPNVRHSLTLQMSPHTLQARYGVDVCHTVQAAGEFICTFPAAFHCGFSHGFNVGEAVNFATAAWLPFGRQAQQLDRQQAHPQCFSLQQLLYTLVKQRLQQQEGDDDDDAVLLSEFEQLVATEQRDRAACVTAGVSRFLPMDNAAVAVPQCAVCLLLCFLSSVHCDRCRLPPVCLQHVAFACSCEEGRDQLRVEYRVPLQQLSVLQHRLRHALSQPYTTSRCSAIDDRKRHSGEAAADDEEEKGRREPAAAPASRAAEQKE